MRVFGSSSFHSFNLEFRSKAHRATLDQELTLFQKLLMLLDLFPSNQSFLITALAQKIYLITVAQRKAEGELKNFNDVFPKSSPKLKLTLRRCLLAQLQFQLSTTPHLASSFFYFFERYTKSCSQTQFVGTADNSSSKRAFLGNYHLSS